MLKFFKKNFIGLCLIGWFVIALFFLDHAGWSRMLHEHDPIVQLLGAMVIMGDAAIDAFPHALIVSSALFIVIFVGQCRNYYMKPKSNKKFSTL